ncbi:MAG: bifunctional demethylmenaquinone methyltransferase/2-methoxy-6-polyprenyl-1,4-benzoquinol methylase UbiE [Acidobacteria bacterium]|nr:bifunctional demethylmenaquinone methyltransferase/2-methoxy-6-polyprenyl-1,4-benzoquinol methylase UbiE [Acidobacteriota bacterium]
MTASRLGATPDGAQDTASAAVAVQQMFDEIAPRYDFLNHVLSAGIDRVWWRRAAKTFDAILRRPESNVLDLCCGTGDMTAALLERRPANGAAITAVDFSHNMIERGRVKLAGEPVNFIEADALHLPFTNASQDLVVSAFGFRNLADYEAGLREIRRVLRPGGEMGILDFGEPEGFIGDAYRFYFRRILPRIGAALSGSGGAYAYLPRSVERFPKPQAMCTLMRDAGFADAAWTPYLFGVAGLFRGRAD